MSELALLKKQIIPVLKKYGIKKAGIFGSYAKGTAKKKSDVDILIQPPKKFSLLDLVGLQNELIKVTNKKIDVNTYRALHPYVKKEVLKSEVKVYG